MLLELERLYNHVADIGALCNDVGFGLAQARALTLREQLLRLNADVTGHRLLRGAIRPGHTQVLRLPAAAELAEIGQQLRGHRRRSPPPAPSSWTASPAPPCSSAQDAAGIGTLGVVARASGLTLDARIAHPFAEPSAAASAPPASHGGDVLARFTVRVEEARASLRLIADLRRAGHARSTRHRAAGPLAAAAAGSGSSKAGGAAPSTGSRSAPRACSPGARSSTPPSSTGPRCPVALADTIVPDFPLANKSFNLSYAGNDL